jgi:hypothetical protein
LLDSYTFEELYFEYYDITGKKDHVAPTETPQEEWDWAEQAEKEEVELEQQELSVEKSDIIEDGSPSDEEWANKILTNPTADEVDDGGDINTNFGV